MVSLIFMPAPARLLYLLPLPFLRVEVDDDDDNNCGRRHQPTGVSDIGIMMGENHNDEESSSSASSLFSHSDDEKNNNDTNQDDVKPAASTQKGEEEESSVGSLFSSSDDEVQDVATTNPKPASPPSTIALNVDRAGFQDNSNRLCGDGGGASDTPQPVYPTFEPPIQKEDPESDESSDEGSLFSLNEREEDEKKGKVKKQQVRKTAHQNSFGSPVIPRKKSAVSSAQRAKSAIPTNQERISHEFARQPSKSLHPDHEVKNKANLKSRVTFDLPIKPAKKYLGKAAKALKKVVDESGTNGKSISCFRDGKATSHRVIKTAPENQPDTAENGIYYVWQKDYKEKLWNREFSKVKKYLREHGNNCDIPDGKMAICH